MFEAESSLRVLVILNYFYKLALIKGENVTAQYTL